jgi:Baseplate J-like protein
MQAVRDEIETIHLYVVREEEKRPATALPLFCAFVCLLGIAAITLYSAAHPYYEHARLVVPAQFLPLITFEAEAPIIPTGIKFYPATYAIGTLTLTNGSVLSEVLPSGVIFGARNGVEVQTTEPVFIPAGSAIGYGVAAVPARAVQAGEVGNIHALAVNAVYGTALYIRNLTPFTGGLNAYSVAIQLPKDREAAIHVVRALMASQQAQVVAFLAKPCKETAHLSQTLIRLSWSCQFVTYHIPSYMRVTAAHLSGKDFLVDVVFVPRPKRMWTK